MLTVIEKPPIKRRTKGEQTRKQILHAAIKVLAKQGIKGTTHRSIATQANLQLSLTTYYFKDIQELVHEAFILSSSHAIANSEASWLKAFELLESYTKTQLKKVSLRKEVANSLCDIATDYVINKVKNNPVELIIEQLMFTEIQITPELRKLATSHRNALLSPFLRLCSYFDKGSAEIDADILLTLFTQLEYRNVMIPIEKINEDLIKQRIKRVIYWITQTK